METRSVFDRLNVPDEYLKPPPKERQGVYSYVVFNSEIETFLRCKYGRVGLCLKVFRKKVDAIEKAQWGQNPLLQCTIIQNIFARHGLAPRIYDVVFLKDGHLAQVTDFATGKARVLPSPQDRFRINEIKGQHMINTCWDMNPKNYIDGKLVDFQPWYFPNEDAYRKRLIELAYTYTAWGSRSEPYQTVASLALKGQRDENHRVQMMGLSDDAFDGMSVLDVGCNLGAMCVEAWNRGAKKVIGVDKQAVSDVAFELTNYLGYWNLDFIGANLPNEKTKICGKYDVIFLLSCNQAKPIPWALNLCEKMLYFEGHVPDREETYRDVLERNFSKVEFLGMTKDHGPRPMFRCIK